MPTTRPACSSVLGSAGSRSRFPSPAIVLFCAVAVSFLSLPASLPNPRSLARGRTFPRAYLSRQRPSRASCAASYGCGRSCSRARRVAGLVLLGYVCRLLDKPKANFELRSSLRPCHGHVEESFALLFRLGLVRPANALFRVFAAFRC